MMFWGYTTKDNISKKSFLFIHFKSKNNLVSIYAHVIDFLFLFFVIWGLNEDFFSRKYFIKINIYWGNGKISTQNLTEKTKNILFKIEHLIHLTKKGKKINFDFFVCIIFLCI